MRHLLKLLIGYRQQSTVYTMKTVQSNGDGFELIV